MQLDLVKAEKKSLDGSLFSTNGYTKSATNSVSGMPVIDAQAIQKMTPEERQKYIEDMKAKYQQPKQH